MQQTIQRIEAGKIIAILRGDFAGARRAPRITRWQRSRRDRMA